MTKNNEDYEKYEGNENPHENLHVRRKIRSTNFVCSVDKMMQQELKNIIAFDPVVPLLAILFLNK